MAETREINLLPYEDRQQERFSSLQKKLSILSVLFLAAAAIFTLVTLVLFTSYGSKRAKLIERVQRSSAEINDQKETEELLLVIQSKASAADKILAKRADYNKVFKSLSELVPQGVYFSDIRITSSKISASGKAKTSADVAGLVASLVSEKGARIITNVSVDSLNSDASGQYSFVISGELTQ